ncbi:glycosyltransferase family 4 protein [Sphingobacterium sp. 2149]|uniref:glycosyltransferase family 4 protein n=1 Tax=Sphingobacterium sp. 2149 TaxID=2817763 RepID=UPI00285F6697|nr:glycosyltransferase family 4 protein [Sphingobacterium sp. 2149]MDR6733875.1 glycosyltransferase involved in cell wall biosynthesis [Sphingobacterium sp. 2149]
MKIVYCILGTYNAGGMERVLANKANYLARMGHELTVVTTDQKARAPHFELDPLICQVDLAINYTDDAGLGIFRKILSYKRRQRIHRERLEALLMPVKADIVISMFDHDVSFLHDITDGSKKVLEIHFSRFKRLQYDRKGLWKLVNTWRSGHDLALAKKYDRFVVLTHEDLTYWKGLKNSVVIPNANTFSLPRRAALTEKRAIAVGRFDYQKGFDQLIAIWKDIQARCSDWKLDIYGQGPLKADMLAQIHALGLDGQIALHAPVKHIMDAYMHSSLVLMSSRYEGLPMTLLEAQACGLPMVAYACKCGPRDIIKPGKNGYLIAEGDRADFANKACRLMEKGALRQQMGQAAWEMAENFDAERIMRQWLLLFERLVKGDRR